MENIWIVGDSLIRGITFDQGLEKTTVVRDWNARFKRGGHAGEIAKIVKDNLGKINKNSKILISAGGNDIDDLIHNDEDQRDRYVEEKVLRPMVRIAEMVRSKGAGMFYWAIPPRRTMYEDNRILVNRRLESNLNGLATQITTELENITWNQYLEECLVDGTHFNEDHCRNVLTSSLQVMGVNSSLFPRDIRIQLHDFIPGVCPACGENHPPQRHEILRPCRKCYMALGKEHTAKACLLKYKMCRNCGIQGHRMEDCRTYR